MSAGRIYNSGQAVERSSECVALVLDSTAVAQIATLGHSDLGEGFSIRVWAPGATAEFGGSNLTTANLMIRFTAEGNAELIQNSFYEGRGQR